LYQILRDPQSQPPLAFCERCQGELYQNEIVYLWEGQALCPACFRTAIRRLAETSLPLLADLLGTEIQPLTLPTH